MSTLNIFMSFGGFPDLVLGFVAFVFIAITLILFIVALLDLFNNSAPTNTKLLWLIVILIAPLLGSLIYLIWGKNQRF